MAIRRKITNRDLADIFYMLLEGTPIRKIAENYCVSPEAIYKRLGRSGVDVSAVTTRLRSGLYPNLGEWMAEHKIDIYRFANMAGISYTYMRKFLDGKANPSFAIIQKILGVTGLTYEQAFATSQTDTDEEES